MMIPEMKFYLRAREKMKENLEEIIKPGGSRLGSRDAISLILKAMDKAVADTAYEEEKDRERRGLNLESVTENKLGKEGLNTKAEIK